MESEPSPIESLPAGELVERAIRDIDESTSTRRDILLFDLLSAAWPEPVAQDQ